MEILMDEMQRALELFKELCTGVGSLSTNLNKTQCALFARKRSLDTSRGPIFYGKTLIFYEEVKYLGVVLDDKLNWKAHTKCVAAKFLNGYWIYRRTVGVTWGLKSKLIIWIWDTVMTPKLTYRSVV